MIELQQQKSDIARVLRQIGEEYEAAQRGMTGLSSGTTQHAFITARMQRMQDLHVELQGLVGSQAIALIVEQLQALPEGAHRGL